MKRTILALIATTVMSLAVAPAFADDIDLKTQAGVTKFWQEHVNQGG